MFIRLLFIFLIFVLSGCSNKAKINPIVGKWSTERTCKSGLVLTKNHQISGNKVIGTWEERKDFVEFNIAQKTKGKLRFVQVLTTKPSAQKMQILQIVYPEQNWPWHQRIGDTLYKC